MANQSGAIDLGAPKPPEEPVAEEQQQEEGPRKVLTAFMIVVDPEGNPQIMLVENPGLDLMVPPTPDIVYAFISTLLKDLSSQELVQVIVPATAQTTVQALQQQAQQAFQAQAAQQQLAHLGDLKGGLRG